jgi:N-methylhydantoinase A
MAPKKDSIRLGIDVGGTFTDFVMIAGGEGNLFKRLSTPADPSIGVIAGLTEMAEHYGFDVSDVTSIVHGTTAVANALIERKGAPTALITTEGFRDVLEIGREVRYDIYDLGIRNPRPLAERDCRFTVSERTLADGTVRSRPGRDEVSEILKRIRGTDIETIAICLLHAHRNPENERAVADVIRAEAPEFFVSLSSDVAPEIREYERTSTTVANAYVRPLVDQYLFRLEQELAELGFAGDLHVMLSQGGIATVDFVRSFPVQIVESGPAAGVQAVSRIARQTGDRRVLSFDMGGTTAKICAVDNYEPDLTVDTEVARIHRFKKGSGLPLKIPSVELIEIGAGGGSIASLDRLRLLRVGPQSAAADPGPACYRRGGNEPTVTDADLLLGYLDPHNFLGGKMELDVAAAEDVIERRIAAPLGISIIDAAAGIVGLANEHMASAARLHVAERGRDAQQYTLVAFGGAGPVHAFGVARLLRVPRLLYPRGAGNLSALGFLVSPASLTTVRTYVSPLTALDWDRVETLLRDMESEAYTIIGQTGVSRADVTSRLSVEMRYVGQGYEIEVPLTRADLEKQDHAQLISLFEHTYQRQFGMRLSGVAVEAINWRLAARGPVPKVPAQAAQQTSGAPQDARVGQRPIYIPETRSFATAGVYDGYRLAPGFSFSGPAVIEERESTFVINGRAAVTVDQHGNVIVEPEYALRIGSGRVDQVGAA